MVLWTQTVAGGIEAHHQYAHGVVETCLRIYGHMSGTGDPMPEAELAKLLLWLDWRVEDGWTERSLPGWDEYENRIREMGRAMVRAMECD